MRTSLITCLSCWLLALSLTSGTPVIAFAATRQAADEAQLRALAQNFFDTWAAKDLDGWLRLWSAQSPELEARKKATQELFASSEKIALQSFVVRQVKAGGDRATVRVEADAPVIDAKTGKEKAGYGKRLRTLECVKENGEWKVWREASSYAQLAAAVSAANNEAERAALLTAEKELVTVELARALRGQAVRSINQGNYAQALSNSQLGLTIAEQIGDQAELGYALANLGYVYTLQGNLPQAKEPLQKGLALMQAHGDQADVARTLNHLGNVYRYQGDYEPALDYYRQSLALYVTLGEKAGIGIELGNIGVVYARQGNLARALDYYQKSLALSEAENDKLGVAITLGNLGAVYRKQGDYAQALDHYQKSMALSEAIQDQIGIAQMLHNLGLVYRFQGKYAQALEFAQKNLAMKERLGDQGGIAGAHSALAAIYDSQGQFAQALESYQKSLALDEASGDKDGVAGTLINLGLAYKNQGRLAQALECAERAAPLARQTGSLEMLYAARTNAGVAHRGLQQKAEARRAFEEAIAIIETMRSQVAGREQEQQRFFETRLAPYLALMDMLAQERQAAEALTFAERAKARVLLDVLQAGRSNITKAMTAQEQEQERAMRAALNALNAQVTRASQPAKPDQTKLNELKAQRDKTRLNYEAFQTALYAAHPELRTQRGEAPIIKPAELTALVPDAASALLEYVVLDDMAYLFTVTKSGVQVYPLPIKRDDLNTQTETLRRQLAARDLGFRATAKQLYAALLKPALTELRGKTNLIIVPDGKLWELPFQALVGANEKYVLETSAVSYAPSLTVLREMTAQRKRPTATTDLLAFGNPSLNQATLKRATLALRDGKLDPLPEAEVKALGQLYGVARSKVYVGAAAREDRAKADAGAARVLHFATHGVLNDAAPMYSHLVLAQGDAKETQEEDGLLEAWELMQMNLQADLAVLSACETARGRFGAGEGVIGLTWALFVAGVPSTVVSQWKVESAATRELMIAFHRHLRSTSVKTTKAAALRQAALSVMKRPATSHPFYWAGFVLVGDGR